MNWKVAGMASTAIVAVALTGAAASAGSSKFTGSVSLAVGQSFEDDNVSDLISPFEVFDDSYTSISGDAKVNIAFSAWNLQLDVQGIGSFIDTNTGFALQRDTGFQGAAHGYYRTDKYAVGLFAGIGSASTEFLPTAEYYFVGLQGQYYVNDAFTVGLEGGYLDSNADTPFFIPPPFNGDDLYLNNAWFANAEVRWYATPKVSVTANLGYISGDAAFGFADADAFTWGAKVEYYPDEKEPLSLFIAYEGRTTEIDIDNTSFSLEPDVHTVKVGITFHFGADGEGARGNDRNGPAWNTQDYGAVVVGGA